MRLSPPASPLAPRPFLCRQPPLMAAFQGLAPVPPPVKQFCSHCALIGFRLVSVIRPLRPMRLITKLLQLHPGRTQPRRATAATAPQGRRAASAVIARLFPELIHVALPASASLAGSRRTYATPIQPRPELLEGQALGQSRRPPTALSQDDGERRVFGPRL